MSGVCGSVDEAGAKPSHGSAAAREWRGLLACLVGEEKMDGVFLS